ncbi:hypothetical protein BSLA_01r0192 [Burkholderia stabilis]|nr:hypothetical protein BSLA_01r0192 [Burkholderia stabilis]
MRRRRRAPGGRRSGKTKPPRCACVAGVFYWWAGVTSTR